MIQSELQGEPASRVRSAAQFLRADPGRVFIAGFSEPQWTAVLLTAGVVGFEVAGVLSFHWWHPAVLVAMIVVIVTLSVSKRWHRITLQQLLHPDHVKEVYLTVNSLHDSCSGLVFLNTGTTTGVHNWRASHNIVAHNDKFCSAEEAELPFTLTGVGMHGQTDSASAFA